MNQIMLAAVCRIIVGPRGRRIPSYGDLFTAYTKGLFADYFRFNPLVTVQTVYKFANRTTPYPHFLGHHYAGDSGLRRNLSDMMGIADACASITLLRQIQAEVHAWVPGHLPPETANSLGYNYVNHNATRHDIAVYLADMMHYALCAT